MSPAINGIKVPQNLLGNLIETNLLESKDTDLQNALKKDGYIYIKNVYAIIYIYTYIYT